MGSYSWGGAYSEVGDYSKIYGTPLLVFRSLEDKHLSISLSLAEKYDLPSWEVLCAHAEFLFTDSR